MRTTTLVAALLVAGATLSLGFASTAREASGEGSISFGHEEDDEGEGRAYFRFAITDGEDVTGTLIFAAEHHHERFPDVVIELGSIDEVAFDGETVKFSGLGRLHDDPVTVSVAAHDNDGKDHADRFVIECTDSGGATVFAADGELFRGDIIVGASS